MKWAGPGYLASGFTSFENNWAPFYWRLPGSNSPRGMILVFAVKNIEKKWNTNNNIPFRLF